MDTRTCKVDIHGRNHEELHETAAPKLDQLPGLIGSQRQLIRSHVADGVSFAGADPSGFLKEDDELLVISLALPPQMRLRNPTRFAEHFRFDPARPMPWRTVDGWIAHRTSGGTALLATV